MAVSCPAETLSSAHRNWSEDLSKLPTPQLHEQARYIEELASELGVWERGGYVPLQPFVVTAGAGALLRDVCAQIKQLLVDYATSRAGGDLHRLADMVGWPDDQRWFLGAKRPLADALGSARSDVFISAGQPRILELNIGTCVNGGTTSAVLSTALLGSPVGSRIRSAYGLTAGSYLDTMVAWVRRRLPGGSPRVALLAFSKQGDEGSLKWADDQAARFAPHGIACDFVPVDGADIVGGSLCWHGTRYDVAIRYFMVSPEVAAEHLDFLTALEHAAGTVLLGSYVSQVFTSKNLLADLYQDDQLTSTQRRLLDYVPWTARLNRPARRGQERVDPAEWAACNREDAVLKPANLYGSRGIVVGHRTAETDWRTAIDTALGAGDYVVQELVRPDSWSSCYWHRESSTLVTVDSPALLGPFQIDGADGGVHVRHPITGNEDDLLGFDRPISLGCVAVAAAEGHP